MKKFSIKLYFLQRSTSSNDEFVKFHNKLMDLSDELDPEPIDITTKYDQAHGNDTTKKYHVLTLTYETNDESAFKNKKDAVQSITKVEKMIDGAGFDRIESDVK